jgi:hypothetical protein
MKKLIWGAVALIVLFVLALNSSILSDQAVAWVKANPKDPSAPLVLYRAGRWCDIMGSGDKALEIYELLYQQYPEKGELCAPALYYSAEIKANGSDILGLRKQALPYLDILLNQYSSQEEWRTKGKQLYDEVNYAH